MISDLNEVIRTLKLVFRSKYEGTTMSDYSLVKKCLLDNVSYKLPQSASRDPLIGFREIIRTTRKIFRPHTATIRLGENSNSAILGSFMQSKKIISDYINGETGKDCGWYIAKSEWPEVIGRGRFIYWLRWLVFVFPMAVQCVWKKNRSNLALLVRETSGTALLMHWLRNNNIGHVYDFLPYELDSNLISILCKAKGIVTTKIPSSGPLSTHNRIMIADEIVLVTPYQNEEFALYQESIRSEKILKWTPEKAHTYIDLYHNKNLRPMRGVIGFYSHGSWIRKEEGHASDGLNIGEAERQLLSHLSHFLKRHTEFRLKIFLHPREKKIELRESVTMHYNKFFENFKPVIMFTHQPTAHCFAEADVAVAAFSSVVFERLFCGFKMLIGNYGIPGFPIPGSTLSNICFASETSMEQKLLIALEQEEEMFFEANQLNAYRYNAFALYANRN